MEKRRKRDVHDGRDRRAKIKSIPAPGKPPPESRKKVEGLYDGRLSKDGSTEMKDQLRLLKTIDDGGS